jgi:SAM-dependent methyltransferase
MDKRTSGWQYYNNYQEVYRKPEDYFDFMAARISTHIHNKKRVDFLDIGCGFGNFLHSFYKVFRRKADYVGMTIANHEIESMKIHLPFIKGLYGNQMDLIKIFNNHKFDVVINFCTLSYLKSSDQLKVVEKMRDVIQGGGLLVIGFIDGWVKVDGSVKQSGQGYMQFYYNPNIFIFLGKSFILIESFKQGSYRVQVWRKNAKGSNLLGLRLLLWYIFRNNIIHWDIIRKGLSKVYALATKP